MQTVNNAAPKPHDLEARTLMSLDLTSAWNADVIVDFDSEALCY